MHRHVQPKCRNWRNRSLRWGTRLLYIWHSPMGTGLANIERKSRDDDQLGDEEIRFYSAGGHQRSSQYQLHQSTAQRQWTTSAGRREPKGLQHPRNPRRWVYFVVSLWLRLLPKLEINSLEISFILKENRSSGDRDSLWKLCQLH